jgi:hypothetical protein
MARQVLACGVLLDRAGPKICSAVCLGTTCLGALLIVGSTLYITRREARLARERAAKGAAAP